MARGEVTEGYFPVQCLRVDQVRLVLSDLPYVQVQWYRYIVGK